MDLFSCCVLVLFVFIGSLRSNTVCYVLCSWPMGSSCCRLHAISLNFAREKSIFLCQTLIFNAVVCLLALNVVFFLSLQPLERRCSLTKGVSYFLLILSCPLQWNLASLSTSIFFSAHSKQGVSLTWKTFGWRGFALACNEGQQFLSKLASRVERGCIAHRGRNTSWLYFYISVSDVIKRQTTFSFVCAAVLAIKMSFGPSALK